MFITAVPVAKLRRLVAPVVALNVIKLTISQINHAKTKVVRLLSIK